MSPLDPGSSLKERNVLFLSGSPEYEQSRKVFNGLIDAHPALIVVPESDEDIRAAIHLARERGLQITVKNGGHSAYGYSIGHECLVIDMQRFTGIQIDGEKGRMRVKAGVLSGELDKAMAEHQLAIPLGDCPGVGVAGIALGGGNGFLSRKYGLTCDSLIGAEMMDADGQRVGIDDKSNAELLWALRGGGQGNFGVVTDLIFQMHPVPAKLVAGSIYFPLEEASQVFLRFERLMSGAPDELNLFIRINRELQGRPCVRIYGICMGGVDEGLVYFGEIRQWGTVLFADVRPCTYFEAQQINASSIAQGISFHWKNAMMPGALNEEFSSIILDCFHDCPNDLGRINIDPMGGSIEREDRSKSAFAYRDMRYILSIIGVWTGKDEESKYLEWVRLCRQRLQPYLHSSACYANYVDLDVGPGAYYGGHLDRLVKLKEEWDPQNLFFGLLEKSRYRAR